MKKLLLKCWEKVSSRVAYLFCPQLRNPDGICDGGDVLELISMLVDGLKLQAGLMGLDDDVGPDAAGRLRIERLRIQSDIDSSGLSDLSKEYLSGQLEAAYQQALAMISAQPSDGISARQGSSAEPPEIP